MEYVLKNEHVRLAVSDFGAEMTSLKLNGFEYLWTPDDAHFNRVSPCLFPITGRFMEGYYTHNEKKYYMTLNGMVMEKNFSTEQISETELRMVLHEDEETLAVYPYSFTLAIYYRLEGNFVHISYDVSNHSEEAMPFSVGNHTAYKWPLVDNDNPNSYFLRFEKPETLKSFSPFGWTDSYITNETIRPLDHSLYINGTRSFKNQRSEWIEYTGANCDYAVRMYNKELPFVANWAKPDKNANLVCIEPTLSISSHGPTIFDREGIHVLQPGNSERISYTLEVYCKNR